MRAFLLPLAVIVVHAAHTLLGIPLEGVEQAMIAHWGSR